MLAMRERIDRFMKGEFDDIISDLEHIKDIVLDDDYSREEIVEEIDDLLDRL